MNSGAASTQGTTADSGKASTQQRSAGADAAAHNVAHDADAQLHAVLAKTTAAALAVSSAEAGRVFEDLALGLAATLEVDAALIAEFADAGKTRMRTLAAVVDGKLLRSFEYDVAQTPCRNIVGRASRFVACGVHPEFAPGTMFAALNFDSYAGYSLLGAGGEQLGIVVALDRKPMADPELTEALLKIFAARAAAELERGRAEASYQAIFDAAEDAIFVHDWDTGAIIDVNDKAAQVYGYTRDEMRRLTVADFSSNEPPYTMDDAHRYLEAAKRGGPVRFEWRRRNRDGSLHWDEVCLKAATIAGRPHILAFTREITERKAALEALQQREEQYREIFTASADALTLWNQDLRIVDVNPAFLRIYGFRREQVVDAGYPAHFPRDYVEDRLQMVRRALAGESSELHTRAYRADGTHFEVELRVIPVRHRGQPHVLAISRDITERRQREEALRASEARYRLLFEMESDAITLADADSLRIIDANRAALQMYGYTREEMLRQTWHQLSVEPTLTAAAVPPGTGTISVPLRRHRRKDGSEFLVEATLTYFELDSRRFELTVIRDISERVARERELRASEARLRATVEAAFDCVIGMDGDGRIIEFNAAAERCFGYTRDQVLGRPLADKIIAPDQRAAHTAGLARYRVSGDGPYLNRRIETVAMRADGTEFPVELAIAAAQGMQDRIFVGYLRDITARKHAEQALRASEEQYRAIFNASADALVLRDADFRIVDVNPAYSQLSGYTREEALGATRVLSQTDAETELRRQQHARVLAGEPLRFETTATRKDGVRVDVEVRGRPVQYRGRPHVLYIARDITAARQAEAQRSALEAQLRQAQKMEALGQLTGGIAHDFNNILASIMGYVVLAAERAQAAHDTKTAGYLENSLDSCRRARDLIQQMLTFSRGRRGERQPLKLCELVQEAAPLLRSSLPSTIAFELDCDRTAAPVLADEVQVGQILLNLCINARDAMHGSGRLVISVRPTSARRAVCASCRAGFGGEFVELAVRDTGTGIEPHVLERMFEPFFSTKEVGKGSGMGLATVHGIVHEHGGHLQVDTEPGAGTTFRVLLPALDAERSRHAPDAPSPDIAVARRLLRGRALLVDDEQAVRHFMTELLHGWGLDVTAAADADEARAAFARADGEFDLVITDQTMPRATGVALAAELHAQRPALPILLYSGRADALPDELPAHGIRAVLDKPIDVSALRRAVEAALDQRPSVTSEL